MHINTQKLSLFKLLYYVGAMYQLNVFIKKKHKIKNGVKIILVLGILYECELQI